MRLVAQESKGGGAFEQRHFYGFRKPGSEVAIRQVFQERLIVDHGPRNRKGPLPVFLPVRIDGVLDSDPGVLSRSVWRIEASPFGPGGIFIGFVANLRFDVAGLRQSVRCVNFV